MVVSSIGVLCVFYPLCIYLSLSYHSACIFWRINVVIDQQTHTNNPQTGPITIHCAAKLSAQCNNAIMQRNENAKIYDVMHTITKERIGGDN